MKTHRKWRHTGFCQVLWRNGPTLPIQMEKRLKTKRPNQAYTLEKSFNAVKLGSHSGEKWCRYGRIRLALRRKTAQYGRIRLLLWKKKAGRYCQIRLMLSWIAASVRSNYACILDFRFSISGIKGCEPRYHQPRFNHDLELNVASLSGLLRETV